MNNGSNKSLSMCECMWFSFKYFICLERREKALKDFVLFALYKTGNKTRFLVFFFIWRLVKEFLFGIESRICQKFFGITLVFTKFFRKGK